MTVWTEELKAQANAARAATRERKKVPPPKTSQAHRDYELRQKHKTIVTLPGKVYMPLWDECHGGQPSKEIKKRLVVLIMKGIKYEELEKRAPVVEAKIPAADVQPVTAEYRDKTPGFCCERPMIDYPDFSSCLVCGGKVLK
jgi:hypothetical protein